MARLGGPVFGDVSTPDLWISALQAEGYRAAYCPLGPEASDEAVTEYACAAAAADIVIAEVGAWSNPISPDETVRRAAIAGCSRALALADRIGARCCVNIAGSRGEQWDGPYPENLSEDTFDLIVDTVREIINAVNPVRTYYTLETMPWIFPDFADTYLRLVRAIDRTAFGVHLDPANLITSPRIFFENGAMIRDCFVKLGPWIRSCHAKDIALAGSMTVHLAEVRPGLGKLDYKTLLTEIDRLNPEIPLMLEHLPNAEEYHLAAAHLRRTFPQHVGVS